MDRPPGDVATERPGRKRITRRIGTAIAREQLAAARERMGQLREFEALYRSHRIVALELERTEPELCHGLRTGRLHAALTERLGIWAARA